MPLELKDAETCARSRSPLDCLCLTLPYTKRATCAKTARPTMRSVLPLCVVALALSAGAGFAQPPGAPVPGCAPPPITFSEPPTPEPGGPENVTMPLPCPVFAGAVVLFEGPAADPRDPHNWSDVLVFNDQGAMPQPGTPAH